MAQCLKKYLDKLGDMTGTVNKTSEEIRALDKRVDEIMRDIKVKTFVMLNNLKKHNRDNRIKLFKEIQEMYKEADKLTTKKISLADKQYDLVDDRIKDLDKECALFFESQRKKHMMESDRLAHVGDGTPEPSTGRKRKGVRKDKLKDPKQTKLAQNAAFLENLGPIAPVVEMPIDPNEPRYCTCHQVSFGEMVMCDNPNCRYGWFHFQCVDLTTTPPGKWFCRECKGDKKKK